MASRMCGQLSLLTVATYLVQAVRAAGKCDAVFKGFSDCLLKLGDSMANYPQGLDDKTNIKTVCTCKSLLFLQEFRRQARELLVFVPVTHRPAQIRAGTEDIRSDTPGLKERFGGSKPDLCNFTAQEKSLELTLGMRPPITMEELGETYQRGTELFSMCTDEDPKGRPAAAHPVEAPEMDVLWSPHTHGYWSLRYGSCTQRFCLPRYIHVPIMMIHNY
ncbi:hypothetical protein MJT46_017346 [Ovis ammon polii x Ovis aries]|nr:hypothetical protein MJT46_017346 [Ovis ammon polii x Ovis aries]